MPHISGPIKFMQRIVPVEEDTDGYCTKFAECRDVLQKHEYAVEVWYDTFAGRNRSCFWFGFSTPGKRSINALVKHCPTRLDPVIELDDHAVDLAASYSILRNPISDTALHKPCLEKYDTSGYSYFGIYDDGEIPDSAKAIEFILSVLASLPDFEINLLTDEYKGFENRQKVSWHLRRERDPRLAQLRKERDDFKCRICERRFKDDYGVLGQSFAEAHHIIPLSQLEGPVSNT
jgi:hypothetical protein